MLDELFRAINHCSGADAPSVFRELLHEPILYTQMRASEFLLKHHAGEALERMVNIAYWDHPESFLSNSHRCPNDGCRRWHRFIKDRSMAVLVAIHRHNYVLTRRSLEDPPNLPVDYRTWRYWLAGARKFSIPNIPADLLTPRYLPNR